MTVAIEAVVEAWSWRHCRVHERMRRKRTSVRTVRVVVLEGRGKDECDAVEWCVESGTGKWTRRKMGQRPEGSAWWNTGIVEWTMEWTLIGSSHFPMPPPPPPPPTDYRFVRLKTKHAADCKFLLCSSTCMVGMPSSRFCLGLSFFIGCHFPEPD